MKQLGEKLRTEREKKALSLHEIGMSLKINPKILQAIEAGETEKLPAKTFLRGFVKSYAQYLKLNTEEIISLFNEEMGQPQAAAPAPSVQTAPTNSASQEASAASTVVKPLPQSNSAKPISPDPIEISQGKVLTIAGSLLLIVIIAFVGKMVDKYQKERVKPDVSVEVSTTTNSEGVSSANSDAPTLSTSDSSSPNQDASSTPASSNSTIATTAPTTQTPQQAPVAPVTASTKPAPPVTTSVPQSTTQAPTTSASATSASSSQTSPQDSTAKPTEVIVEALNKVQIRYSLGNDKFDNIELAADQFHTFKSKLAIQLEISDGGSVNLIVNGRDKGVPGTIGKPIKLSYPK